MDNTTDTAILDATAEEAGDKPWGPAIGAAIVVQLSTLAGVLIVAANILYRKWHAKENDSKAFTNMIYMLQHLVVPSFAAGALLATAVFLIIPEAIHLLGGGHAAEHEEDAAEGRKLVYSMLVRALAEGNETDHSEEEHADEHAAVNSENQVAWKFGAALLGGFLFPLLLGAIFPEPEFLLEQAVDEEATTDVNRRLRVENNTTVEEKEVTDYDVDQGEPKEGESVDDVSKPTLASTNNYAEVTKNATTSEIPSLVQTKNVPLAVSILVGDFFHNLSDGFFIGTAFLLCSKSIGWAIVASTIYHELAQEIADYILLTTHCGLSTVVALVLNFISGCSVLLGAVIVLSVELDEPSIGAILSVSAGVYLYIGVGECIPRVQNVLRTPNVPRREKLQRTLIFFVFFVCGAVPIGLVLLNHGHCEE
jgi:zinc transporter ZupT